MAGARSYAAIGQYARMMGAGPAEVLGMGGRRPEQSTFRRVLSALDASWLDWAVGAWLHLRCGTVRGRRVLSFDGKTVRGARTGEERAPHLLSAILHGVDAIVTQERVPDKTNEIPRLRSLLARFDLHGVLVVADALHTQVDTASAVLAAGGHYLFTVKRNQLGLLRSAARLAWRDVTPTAWVDRSKGRRVRRTIKVVDAVGWIDFPGASQVAQLTRRRTVKGKTSVETVYLVTSLAYDQACPDDLAEWVRAHWHIENRVHWVRDWDWDEDRQTARTGAGPQVMATLRNIAVSLFRLDGRTNVAEAIRDCSWNPRTAPKLILARTERTLP
jgi:predicted transposase YbfD/YdcC